MDVVGQVEEYRATGWAQVEAAHEAGMGPGRAEVWSGWLTTDAGRDYQGWLSQAVEVWAWASVLRDRLAVSLAADEATIDAYAKEHSRPPAAAVFWLVFTGAVWVWIAVASRNPVLTVFFWFVFTTGAASIGHGAFKYSLIGTWDENRRRVAAPIEKAWTGRSRSTLTYRQAVAVDANMLFSDVKWAFRRLPKWAPDDWWPAFQTTVDTWRAAWMEIVSTAPMTLPTGLNDPAMVWPAVVPTPDSLDPQSATARTLREVAAARGITSWQIDDGATAGGWAW